MKRTILLLAALVICASSFAQTIRRVNNIPGAAAGVNTYTTIQEAVDAASGGDIIYVEPSVTIYDGGATVNINKKVHLIGNGNFLNKNPNTPYAKSNSWVNVLNFQAGSGNSTVTSMYVSNSITIDGVEGIQIKRNLIAGVNIYNTGSTGTLISQNIIWSSIGASGGGSNTTVVNNIVGGQIASLTNSIIQHNTVYYSINAITNCTGSVIINNIIDSRGANSFYDYSNDNLGSNFTNNLLIASTSATLPTPNPDGNFNVYSIAPESVFSVANPWETWGSLEQFEDARLQLSASSPAKGIGTGGADTGAFAGTSPYQLSTLPSIPIITSAVTTGAGNASVPLNVTISVKSN